MGCAGLLDDSVALRDALCDALSVIVHRMALVAGFRGDTPSDVAHEITTMVGEKIDAVLFAQETFALLTAQFVKTTLVLSVQTLKTPPTAAHFVILAEGAYGLQQATNASMRSIQQHVCSAVSANALRLGTPRQV